MIPADYRDVGREIAVNSEQEADSCLWGEKKANLSTTASDAPFCAKKLNTPSKHDISVFLGDCMNSAIGNDKTTLTIRVKQLRLLFLSWHLGVKIYLLQSKGKSVHPDCQGRVQRAEGEHPHGQLLHLSWDAGTTYTGLVPWMAKITPQDAIPCSLQA